VLQRRKRSRTSGALAPNVKHLIACYSRCSEGIAEVKT
jgi:hypothetical protein